VTGQLRLSVQECLLPGDTLLAKWDAALASGFEAIELRGQGGHRLRERLPELRTAAREGVVMPTVCVDMPHFIGDFAPELRADAIAQLRTQLSVIAELGGLGAMTPASYGLFSRRLPPFHPPRSETVDREVLLDALSTLGEHAQREGVLIMLEPLNRYEDYLVNRLETAVELAGATGLASVRVVADTYHGSIEEADPCAAVLGAAPQLAHVQVSDTNRLEPGAGHLDWPPLLAALRSCGYAGDLALECRLSGPAAEVLPTVPAFLRKMGA
jgi:sugar phosphate isomerase/epimerase